MREEIQNQIQNILESDKELSRLLPSARNLTQLWFLNKNARHPDEINKSILLIFVISLLDKDDKNLRALLSGLNYYKPNLYSTVSYKTAKNSAKNYLRKNLISMYKQVQLRSLQDPINIFSFGASSLFDDLTLYLEMLYLIGRVTYDDITYCFSVSILVASTNGHINLINKLSTQLKEYQDHALPQQRKYKANQDDIRRIFNCPPGLCRDHLNQNILDNIGDTHYTTLLLAILYGGIDTLRALIKAIYTLTDKQTANEIIRSRFIEDQHGNRSNLLLILAKNGKIKELQFCIDYITEHYPDDFPKVVSLITGEEEAIQPGREPNDDKIVNIFFHISSAYLQALSRGHIETAEYLYNLVINQKLSSGEIFTDETLYMEFFSNPDLTNVIFTKAIELRSADTYKYIMQKIVPFYLHDMEAILPNLITIFMSVLDKKTILFELFSFIPDDYMEPILNAFEMVIHEANNTSDKIIDELREEFDIPRQTHRLG